MTIGKVGPFLCGVLFSTILGAAAHAQPVPCPEIPATPLDATAITPDFLEHVVGSAGCRGKPGDPAAADTDVDDGDSGTRGFKLVPKGYKRKEPDDAPAAPSSVIRRVAVTIHFELNQAELSFQRQTGETTAIKNVADYLKAHQGVTIVVTGHTDITGNFAYNMRLSQRRADAVGDYLQAFGVTPDRIEKIGRGPVEPIPGLPLDDGRQRRVDFTFRI